MEFLSSVLYVILWGLMFLMVWAFAAWAIVFGTVSAVVENKILKILFGGMAGPFYWVFKIGYEIFKASTGGLERILNGLGNLFAKVTKRNVQLVV